MKSSIGSLKIKDFAWLNDKQQISTNDSLKLVEFLEIQIHSVATACNYI